MSTSIQKTILLVEDEAILAMSQISLLKNHGYNVIHIFNGEKTIKLVKERSHKFDLILMDIDLGSGIDGTQTAEAILSIFDVPIVFLSAHTEKEVVEKTEKITSYGYVVKNSGITVLDASIKMAFKLFEAHKDINKQNMLINAGNENLRVTIDQLEKSNNNLIIAEKESSRRTEEIQDKAFWLSEAERIGMIGSYKLDISKGVWTCSSVLDKIFGIEEDDLKSLESWNTLVHPDQREELMDYFTKFVVLEKKPFNKEYRIIRTNDKEVRWVWGRGELHFNSDGTPSIMIGVIQDITEQKLLEDKIMKKDIFLSKVIDNAGGWIWEVDKDGMYSYSSSEVEDILGYSPDELIGKKHFYDLFDEESKKETIASALKVFEQKNSFEKFINYINHKDGSRIVFETSGIPLIDSQGELIGYRGIDIEITDRNWVKNSVLN